MLKHPDTINLPDLQIWNNAVFDNGSSTDDQTAIKPSCGPLQPISLNGSETLKSVSCKENNTPSLRKSPVLTKSPVPIKPLHPNGATEVSQPKPIKLLFKQGLLALSTNSEIEAEPIADDRKIDTQIEEIEAEISRLSSKLESLRIEKAEEGQKLNNAVAPEKFEKTPSSIKIRERRVTLGPSEILGIRSGKPEKTPFPSSQKFERTQSVCASKTIRQRGVSLGPSEILGIRSQNTGKPAKTPISTHKLEKTPSLSANKTIRQRGVSMGPSEIMGIKSQYSGKPEKTPIQSTLNRRKSCFLKLPEIEEENSKQKGGRSSSLSPKSRLTVSKIPSLRQGFTTIGSKKTDRKSNGILSSVQSKKLFKEDEKSVSAKKPIKPGRVVASRYNQSPVTPAGNLKQTELRKSLPGTNKDNNSKGFLKKRASLAGPYYDLGSSRNQITESRANLALGIRNEEVLCDKHLEDFPPPAIFKNDEVLPRIRTLKCKNESPRDSGPAKKVAELIGRKSYFAAEEIDVSTSVCQALSFDDEEEER